jgi:TP901 family phage tail tape measure protein
MSDQKLTIAIGGKLDASLTSAVNSAEGMLDRLNGGSGKKSGIGQVFEGVGKTVTGVAKASMEALGGITTGMIAAGAASVNTGMDFESAMSDLAGTAGITKSSEAFAQYQEAARQVGATTNKTATEAAEALKYMALAGWNVSDSTQALDDMVKLSSASNTDLARTSDLVTDSMGALGLTMEDYSGYMDMVARADSAANYSSAEFMETMIGAGGSARLLGIDLNELGTAAGILANNGTKGSEAGTALNGIFTRLAKQSKPVADALSSIGVSIADEQGNFLSFEDMLGNIKEGLANVEDAEKRAQISANLFGTNYQSEAQYLLDSIGDNGAWDSLQTNLENARNGVDEFGNAADTLNDRYSTATDNLQGDLDILKSSISDFGIEIYDSLVGGEGTGIRGAVQEMTEIIGQLKESFKVDGLDGLAKGIGEAIGDVSATIGEKGANVVKEAGDFASELVKSIGGEGADVGGAAAKIITEIGNSFVNFTDDFVIAGGQLIQGLMDGLVAEGTAEQWTAGLSAMITNIGTWFSENGEQLGTTAGTLVTQLATGLAEHADDILSGGIAIVGGIARGILAGLPILIGQLPNIMMSLVGGVIDSIPQFLSAGKEIGSALMEGLSQIAESWNGISTDMAMEDLYQAGDAMEYLAQNAEAMQPAMEALWSSADRSNLTQETENYVNSLISGKRSVEELNTMIESSRGFGDTSGMENALSTYTQLAQGAMEQLTATQQEAEATVEAVGSATEGQAEQAAQSIEELQSSITDQFTQAQAEAEAAGTAINESLKIEPQEMDADALSAVINSIDAGNIGELTAAFSSAMTEMTTSANTAATAVQTSLTTMGTTVQSQVSASITSMRTSVGADFAMMILSASTTANSIYNAFASIDLGSVASNMMAGLVAGIEAGGVAAIAKAQEIAAGVSAAMNVELKINSPSKVTEKIGYFTGAGLGVGLEDSASEVASASQSLADTAAGSMASNVLTTFASAPASAPAQGGGVVFSPQITINGSANETDLRSALSWSMEQFRQMYRQLQAEDRRTSFA